jgi:signal peptidase II
MENNKNIAAKILPLLLTVLVILTDQITKFIIVKTIPPFTIGESFFGGLLRIVHVSNTGVAFSVGDTLPDTIRHFLFAIVPLIVIILVLIVYFRNDSFTRLQRWTICGIVGGGLGNLLDRFVRTEGVVDFIDVKFFGILGFDRWPTFNVADSSIVVCGIILVISFIVSIAGEEKTKKEESDGRK